MKDNTYEIIDDLLRSKRYDELEDSEITLVNENLGGKAEYDKLSSIVRAVGSQSDLRVSTDIKTDLIRKIKQRNRPFWMLWLSYKMPSYASVLLVLIVFVATYYLRPVKEVPVEKIVNVPSVPVVDTLVIELPPDTVFIEKIIRTPIYLTKQEEKEEEKPTPQPNVTVKGKSLADQGELRSLLIESE